MVVSYFGNGSFRLQSGETSLLLNPESNRMKADAVLRTVAPAAAVPPTDEIVFPGEYEVKGIEVRGLPIEAESTEKYLKTIFMITWEEMRFAILGHLSHASSLDEETLEEIGEPDLLFVPTGDHLLPPAEAARLVKRLAPAVAIPVAEKDPTEFLKAAGVKGESAEKLVFKKKDLAQGKGRVVVLEARG